MKEFFQKLIEKINNPKGWFLALWYSLTAIACALSILAVIFIGIENDSLVLSILAYCAYGVAGITLSYTVYTIVRFAPRIKRGIVALIKKSKLGAKLLETYDFRSLVTAGIGAVINLFFVVFNLALAIFMQSFWYGSMTLYYAILVVLRSSLVFSGSREDGTGLNTRLNLKKYRATGVVLTLLPLCLVIPILQIVFLDRAFIHEGWSVFAFAAYAFYKIIMAIVNIFKSAKKSSISVRAIRCVGLADAMVAIFSLQTSLLYTFAEGSDYWIANVATGSVVCVLTIALGVYMVISSCRAIKALDQSEWDKINSQQQDSLL